MCRAEYPDPQTISHRVYHFVLIMLLAIALTWIIPAGAYAKLSYNPASHMLTINTPQGKPGACPPLRMS